MQCIPKENVKIPSGLDRTHSFRNGLTRSYSKKNELLLDIIHKKFYNGIEYPTRVDKNAGKLPGFCTISFTNKQIEQIKKAYSGCFLLYHRNVL